MVTSVRYHCRNIVKKNNKLHCASSLLVLASNPTEVASSQFALWVAFFEIYNECVYDLLQPLLCSKSKKRAGLRVCDDGAGNAYVKGVCLSLSYLNEVESSFVKGVAFQCTLCFYCRSEVV